MNQLAAKSETSDVVLTVLIETGHLIEQQMEEALQPHGLSLAKLGVLTTLVQHAEPVSLSLISREQKCVKSNITQLVDRLEAEKLVRRVPDPEDRRSIRASITDEGRLRYTNGSQALEQVRQRILSNISSDARDHLLRLLEQMGNSY